MALCPGLLQHFNTHTGRLERQGMKGGQWGEERKVTAWMLINATQKHLPCHFHCNQEILIQTCVLGSQGQGSNQKI